MIPKQMKLTSLRRRCCNGVAAATPGTGRIAKLGKDMISLDGNPVKMQTPYLFEDSSLIKIGDTWYYSYCSNWNVPSGNNINGVSFNSADIVYMTSKNPLGPWGTSNSAGIVFRTQVHRDIDNGGNNHHSVICFKNKLYVAYHSRQQAIRMTQANGYKFYNTKGELTNSADGNYRSTQINEATFNNGKITCSGDMKGCKQIETLNPYETRYRLRQCLTSPRTSQYQVRATQPLRLRRANGSRYPELTSKMV